MEFVSLIDMAAPNGHLGVIKILKDNTAEDKWKAMLNQQNSAGNTGLHWAVLCNKKDVAEYLISEGIDAEIKNADGKNAFDISLEFGLGEIMVR